VVERMPGGEAKDHVSMTEKEEKKKERKRKNRERKKRKKGLKKADGGEIERKEVEESEGRPKDESVSDVVIANPGRSWIRTRSPITQPYTSNPAQARFKTHRSAPLSLNSESIALPEIPLLIPHIHSSTNRPGRSSQTANPTGISTGLLSSSSSSSHSTSSTSSHLISPLAATYFSLPTSNSQPPSDPSRFGATILGDYLIPPYAEDQFLSQVLAPYSHNPSDEVQYNTKIAALWTSLFKRKLGPPTEPFVDWQTDQDLGNSKARDGTVYAQTWMQEVVRSVRREFGLLTESSAVASRRSGHSDSPLALGKSTPRLISRSSPLPILSA